MSADRQIDPARARCNVVSITAETSRVMRSSVVSSSELAAPRFVVLPISSWSNSTITRIASTSVSAVDEIACTAAQHDARLSSRGAEMSASSRPINAPGCDIVEHDVPEQDVMRPRRRARTRESGGRRPAPRSPVPHTGTRCCCGLSTSPLLFTSRSRWMASCGMRATGRSMLTSSSRPPRSATRPAMPRSRSSQELKSAPP